MSRFSVHEVKEVLPIAARALGLTLQTLVINSVKPKEGGGWVAEGRYGTVGSNLGRQTFDVSVQEGNLIVEFITSAKNPAKLKLVGDNKLEGKLNVVVKRGSGDRGFKLEKVAPKAGDVK